MWHQDLYGKCNLWGYGFLNVPTQQGFHKLTCRTWRPVGNLSDQIITFFSGEGLQLTNKETILSSNERYKIQTEPEGEVKLHLYVIPKDFGKFGIETK